VIAIVRTPISNPHVNSSHEDAHEGVSEKEMERLILQSSGTPLII